MSRTVAEAVPGRLGSALRGVRARGRAALVPYATAGITSGWTDLLLGYADAGADAVEIGLPFSDPVLDGVTIQQAGDAALARGATPGGVLAELERVRGRLDVPVVVMTYANLVVRRGAGAFCRRLAAAGVDGLIVPDVPVEELDDLSDAATAAGIELVLLLAPSTGPARLREVCRRSRGFVYAVSTMGATGERRVLDPEGLRVAAEARAVTDLPVLVGFGISTAEQAVAAAGHSDGVVMASALMRRVLDGATPGDVAAQVAVVRRELDHHRQGHDASTGAQVPHDRGRPDREDP